MEEQGRITSEPVGPVLEENRGRAVKRIALTVAYTPLRHVQITLSFSNSWSMVQPHKRPSPAKPSTLFSDLHNPYLCGVGRSGTKE